MRHLTEEQLVGLVLEDRTPYRGGRGTCADSGRRHLGCCSECRLRYDEVQRLTASLSESRAIAPVSAWSLLKGRLERSRPPRRDWTEPRWFPLVFVNLAVVIVAFALILVLGGWLESSSLWDWIRGSSLISMIGPRGLVGFAFIAGGGLCVLALTPVLWWESRTRGL